MEVVEGLNDGDAESGCMLFVRAQALPNKRVLIVAHENITNNYYPGNNRSCLVSNCLFRVGGAACLMSNRRACLPAPWPEQAPPRIKASTTASAAILGFHTC